MNYKYFIHNDCSYYPCHNLADWKSCLFCWCPLYLLDCAGDFVMRNGIKDCSGCGIPHAEEGYDYVLEIINNTLFKKTAQDIAMSIKEKSHIPLRRACIPVSVLPHYRNSTLHGHREAK